MCGACHRDVERVMKHPQLPYGTISDGDVDVDSEVININAVIEVTFSEDVTGTSHCRLKVLIISAMSAGLAKLKAIKRL